MCKILIPILLFCSTIKAADVPVASSYRDFSGGLNNDDASVSLPANESPDLLNVIIDEKGQLTQRKGYLSCGNTPSGNTATAMYEYSKNNGSRNLILSDNISIWQTADCINFSTIATGLNSLDLPRFATVRDKLWAVNGSTWPIVWDGTTASLLDGHDASTPTGPKGRLITYWKSRVWIGNTATDPSGLHFSALVDGAGNDLDPATSTAAWVATNLIYFNRDNGSPLYAIKVYRDNLYAFKENDILRLVFESEYTANGVTVTKTASKTGSKFQESIVEMDDGLLRFVGRDGVYAFDGSMVKRVSDKWTPTFYVLKQPSHSEAYTLWDNAIDFSAGTLSNLSSTTITGSLTLFGLNHTLPNYGAEIDGTSDWKSHDSRLSNTSFWGNYVWYKDYGTSCSYTDNYFILKDSATGSDIFRHDIVSSNGIDETFTFNTSTLTETNIFIYHRIRVGAVGHTVQTNGFTNTYSTITFRETLTMGGTYCRRIFDIAPSYISTGTYTSQVATATALTVWKNFESDETLNGQDIAYQIRTGATAADVLTAEYRPITPGTIISSGTDIYYQWLSSFTTTDSGVSPALNSVSAGWITGDATKSPISAINYQSRYWMSASTTIGNDYNDITMVNSKSPMVMSWTKFDLPLSAMTLWNNNLYGAIGDTSKIVRLEYGETDDGTAITSYYDSPDDVFGNPLLYKTINKQIVDFASVPNNDSLKLGLSNDLGATWSYKTFDSAKNPALIRNTQIINMNANNMLQFRSRLFNNKLGIGYKIYGIHAFGTAGQFAGN